MKNNIYSKTYLKNIINYIYIRRNLTKGVDYFTCGKELKILFSIIFIPFYILFLVTFCTDYISITYTNILFLDILLFVLLFYIFFVWPFKQIYGMLIVIKDGKLRYWNDFINYQEFSINDIKECKIIIDYIPNKGKDWLILQLNNKQSVKLNITGISGIDSDIIIEKLNRKQPSSLRII